MIARRQWLTKRISKFNSALLGAVIFLLLISSSGWAQQHRFEVTPFGGYQFLGKTSVYYQNSYGDIDIKDSGVFGFSINVPMVYGAELELFYSRQDSRLNFKNKAFGTGETLFDMSVEYFQIGALRGIQQGNLLPFGVVTLGATHFNPKDDDFGSEWRFSFTFGLGGKVYLSERIGLRLQGTLLMPIQWAGGSVWFGTGGPGVGVSAGSSVIQIDVRGGLIILL
jgi:hypothetical protein